MQGEGGRGDRRCPSGAQGYGSTLVTQGQQEGARGCMHSAGSRVQLGSCPLCTSLPASSELDTLPLLPMVLPVPAPWVPRAGRDSREMCTSAERAGGGEDEPDNYCLESLTRVPSKIMAQILRKGAL